MPPLFQLQGDVMSGMSDTTPAGPDMTKSYYGSAVAFLTALRANPPGAWSDNRLEQAQHFIGIAYTAIRALCEGMASTKPEVYDISDVDDTDAKGASGAGADEEQYSGRPVGADHPLVQLLNDPNPEDTWSEWVYEATLQKALTGNHLSWKVENTLGEVAELWVIPTAIATAMPRSPTFPHGAWRVMPVYAYGPYAALPSSLTAAGAILDSRSVLHQKNKHPWLKYDGYSALTAGSFQMDILEAIDTARWNAHQSGILPLSTIEYDANRFNLTQEQLARFQTILEEKFAGKNNFGKGMLLPPGFKVNPFSHPPSSMGFESDWEQMRDFVLSLFGVPKGVLGVVESTSYAALYASLKQYFLITLGPLAASMERFLTKFLASSFGRNYRIRLKLPKLDDPDMRERQIAQDDTVGIRTWNERRQLRGLPPLEGEEWDEPMGKASQPQPGENPFGEDGEEDEQNIAPFAENEEATTKPGADEVEPVPAGEGNDDGKGSLPPKLQDRLKTFRKSLTPALANGSTPYFHDKPLRPSVLKSLEAMGVMYLKAREGLVPKKVTVRTKHGTHERTVWVRPGGGSGKKPAGKAKEEKKPVPKAKASGVDVEKVIDQFKGMQGKATPAQVKAAAESLKKMTVAQITLVKKAIGAKASGTKEALADKVASALAKMEKPPSKEKKPGKNAPTPERAVEMGFTGIAANGVRYVNGVPQKSQEDETKPKASIYKDENNPVAKALIADVESRRIVDEIASASKEVFDQKARRDELSKIRWGVEEEITSLNDLVSNTLKPPVKPKRADFDSSKSFQSAVAKWKTESENWKNLNSSKIKEAKGKLKELNKRSYAILTEQTKIETARLEANKKARESLRSTLKGKHSAPPKVSASDDGAKRLLERFADASAFLGDVCNWGASGSAPVNITTDPTKLTNGDRANYKKSGSSGEPLISMQDAYWDQSGTFVHEYGHHIETKKPDIQANAQAFLKYRTEGETDVDIGKATNNPGLIGEMGKKDQFDKHFQGSSAYYVGKHYWTGDTEIVSMGVEALYEDPIGFCTNDPEYAQFIIAALKHGG